MAFGYDTPKEAQEVVEQGFGVHDESADNAAVRAAHICGPSADRRLTRCNLVLQAVEAAAKQLETDLAKGIDPNTLQQREDFFGQNYCAPPPPESIFGEPPSQPGRPGGGFGPRATS